MAKAKTDLVIVESPAKARTIEKYLGSNYHVVASMGHLRDLPKSTMGVDIDGDFTPQYLPVKDRADVIADLKKRSKAAGTVYLATDPDREGEAISWHLKELLNLPDDKAKRVTFNEITKKVVTESIQHPREIDQDLVDAQQARRVLDRLVGYKISPLLWAKVRKGLSAGRVQSVATRMIVDREAEIDAFVPQEYWTITAKFTDGNQKFVAKYVGKGDEKTEITSEAQAKEVRDFLLGQTYSVTAVKSGERRKNPPPPFTTSNLQQEAVRKLSFTTKKTMQIAQMLYEGVDIEGEGSVGLISYIRTDSTRLSDEALTAAREYIADNFSPEYLPETPNVFKGRKNAQDAHEAIRPSNVRLDPESIQADLTREQYRLYKLIWSRFVACQMSDARYDAVQIDARCAGHAFRASDQILKFSGFTAVYEEGRDDEAEERSSSLPDLDGSERLTAEKQEKAQHFTQPPARYTEATLVKAMEERGVGRPSTYASIVATIQDREYVIKKDKRLWPTPLGRVVTELMIERFRDIIDVEFTANMEHQLDEVEAGKVGWKTVLRDFYQDFHREMEDAGASAKQIMAAFDKPCSMKVFTYRGERDTLMTPRDSILHHKRIMRASFVALDPRTGYVKAYVGGPNFRYFKYDMAKQGKRQIGSTIKPFVYTFAIDHLGLTPCTMVPNLPVTIETANGTAWSPKEAGNVEYDGVLHPLKWGLARSRNNYSAWIMKQAKQPAAVADFIHNMGIRSFIDPVPALCLGSSESNVFELVSAFSTFANEGVHTDPIFVTRIEDRQGNVIANFIPQSQDAVSERTAYTMLTMLQDVVNSGTAGRLKWQFGLNDMEIGGKTGTSNKNRDAWFMCVAPKLVAGAWVGGEDQAVHFVAGGEGSVMALPIVGDFMKRVYDDGRLGVSRADQFIRPAMMPRYDCDEEVDPDERPTEPGIAEDDNFFD